MIESALGFVREELDKIGVPYEFMRWTSSTKPNRYWIGEYSVTPTNTEDGYKEFTLLLTGTTQDLWSVLMQDRAKIEDHFPNIGGLSKTTEDGVVVIFYENDFPVPTGEADLKRLQINLRIKAWKGMK